MIICPNLNNKEVAQQFQELVDVVGEVAAYDIWSQNEGNAIDRAPNGAPSKLFTDLLSHFNGDRVLAVQAKAKVFSTGFKEWFGESKVVDENGEPLIVYHNTTEEFDTFNISFFGQTDYGDRGVGFYFTPSKDEYYSGYGPIRMPVFLSIKNPVPHELIGSAGSFNRKYPNITVGEEKNKRIETLKFIISDRKNKLYGDDPDYSHYRVDGSLMKTMTEKELSKFEKELESLEKDIQSMPKEEFNKGIYSDVNTFSENDGVIGLHPDEDPNNIAAAFEIVVKSPNQIKSAVGNTGEFSTENNNIYKDISDVTEKATTTDPTMRDRLFNGKSTTTVSEVLDNIFATNSGLQDLVTTIKDSLNEEISNINIEVETRTDSDRRATAYFDANTNTITVYDNARFKWADGLSDRTILHEIIHAFTTRELKINDAVRIEAETLLSEVRAQLEIKYGKDYETLIKERPIEFYGIKNVNEFLSEIFMNSYFVEELTTLSSKTKYSTVGSTSIYRKVINWIAKLIGLNKDAYTEGYRLLEKIMHEHKGYTRLNSDLAPNGEKSILFTKLLEIANGDYTTASIMKTKLLSKEFIAWFGDWTNPNDPNVSKVVDENGEPKIVWHHSNEPITEFKKEFDDNYFAKDGGSNRAIFFTGTKTPESGTVLDRKYSIPVFLSIKNPYVLSEKKGYKQKSLEAVMNGNDGMFMLNINDNQMENQDIYVSFDPNLIKSATNNSGEYSVNNPSIYSDISTIADPVEREGIYYDIEDDDTSDTSSIDLERGPFMQLVYDPKNTGAMLPGYQSSAALNDALKSDTFLNECTFEYTVSKYDKAYDINDFTTWDNAAIHLHMIHKSGKKYVTVLRTPETYAKAFKYKDNDILQSEIGKLIDFRNSIIEASKVGKVQPGSVNRTNGSLNTVRKNNRSVQRPIQDVPAFKIPADFDMSNLLDRFAIGKGIAGDFKVFTVFGKPVDAMAGSGTSLYTIPAQDTPNKKNSVTVKVNIKRFTNSQPGTIELILRLLADYKANDVDNIIIDGKELPITPFELLDALINFGESTRINKSGTSAKEEYRNKILEDKQLFIDGDYIHIGKEIFKISDLTIDKKNTDAYRRATEILGNMHYSVEKNTIWNKLDTVAGINKLKPWMERRGIQKLDIVPGEISFEPSDFKLSWLGWLIKGKKISSDLADDAFSSPFLYADGVVSTPSNNSATPVTSSITTTTSTTVSNKPISKLALAKLTELYANLVKGLNDRVKTVSKYTNKNIEQISNMQRLIKKLEYDKLINELTEAEQQEGVVRFVSYLSEDIINASRYIDNAMVNPALVNSNQLNQLNTDYIGFYKPMLQEVKRLLDTTDFLDGIKITVDDGEFTKRDVQKYVNDLIVEFTSIGNKYDALVETVSATIVKSWGESTGSNTLSETIEQLTSVDKDILYIARYMGMSSQLNDEALRLMHLTITNAKNEVARSTNRKGQSLISLTEKLNNVNELKSLYEKTKDGKFTGFLVRDLNYGEHYKLKRSVFDAINSEFGIENDADAAKLPEVKRKEYRRKLHEWHTIYSERRFIPEYYEAGLSLSDATVTARDNIQTEMNIIMSKATDKNNRFNPTKLSTSQRNALRHLVRQKANLSNLYYLDGSPKSGTDLEIALELKEFNQKTEGKLKYKANMEAYYKERDKMLSTLTPDQFKIWEDFNNRITYDEAFYRELAEIERVAYGAEYTKLKEERDELLKLTKDANAVSNDPTLFSNAYLVRIKDIDVQLDKLRRQAGTKKIHGKKFSDIAMIEIKPEWRDQFSEAFRTKDDSWLSKNTVIDPVNGEYRPTSVWTYIRPKNEAYIRKEPNRFWSEISGDSEWVNKNYDDSDNAEFVQPKRKFFDNRVNYNKIQGTKALKDVYDALVATTREANGKVSFLNYSSSYKIPQISARMMEMVRRRGDLKESVKFISKDMFGVNNDDSDYVNEFAKRPDGSYIKFVPTHFLEMLEDTNMITSDLIGAYTMYHEMAENYKQMNAIAPDMELVVHQLGKRKVTKKVGVKGKTETIEGKMSNVFFKAVNLMDMEVYGKRKENVEVKLPTTNIRISVTKVLTKFTDYVRKVNLFNNVPAMLTGFTTAATYEHIESVLGRYYTVGELNDANKTVMGKLPQVVANLGNANHKDILGAMLMYNQVTRSNQDTYKYLDQSKVLRAINKHFWYSGYSMGDFIVKSSMMVAIYKDHKLVGDEFISRSEFITRNYPNNKTEGNKVWETMKETLYDAYTIDETGMLTPKPKYAQYITTRLENKIKNLSNHLAADLDGVLNDSDRSYVHQNAYLQLLFLHRNFMIIGAHKRFKSRQYNHMTQFEEEGMYLTPVRFLFDAFKSGNIMNMKALLKMYNEAEPYEKYNIKRTAQELITIMILALVVVPMLNSIADEDPDNWFTNEMAYVALRTRFELSTMYNPLELINMLNSPSAATGTIEQLSGIIKILMVPNWFGSKSAFSEVTNGPYEGMPRFTKNLIKGTPLKSIFEVQDPRSKRKYMETQLTF